MTAVAAYVVLPALLLGHQGQDWPLAGVWRAVRARWPRRGLQAPVCGPQSPSRDSRVLTQAPSAPQRRPCPSWANTQPINYEEAA